jgi:hypothetical protein
VQQQYELMQGVQKEAEFGATFTPEAALLDYVETRRILYKLWWAYFDNSIYNSGEDGGYRQLINTYLGSARVGNLAPHFNPVDRAVRAYEYVFDGNFGDEVYVDEKIDKSTPVNDKLIDPLASIWKWSGINQWKSQMLVRTATLGTTGMRISYKGAQATKDRQIRLTIEHPSRILNLETDDRGNITQLVLEYERVEGNFYDSDNPRQQHHYIEYMSREEFWMMRDGMWWNFKTKKNVDDKEQATITNPLGIVPYVLIKQNNIGADFGVPSFYGQERRIDHLNALAAHINAQIRRHVTATWLLEAGGPPPEKIPLGDMTIWYVQKELGMNSAASITPLVANLNLADAISQQDKLYNELGNSMPELKATDGAFLSHQSGGTVSQLRIPAEQRILSARTSIEDGLVKAQKIALSTGILYNMWDLGTGMGSRAAADRAYQEGYEDHRFNKRPALPRTVDDQLTMAKAKAATQGKVQPGGDNTSVPPEGTDLSELEDVQGNESASSGGVA